MPLPARFIHPGVSRETDHLFTARAAAAITRQPDPPRTSERVSSETQLGTEGAHPPYPRAPSPSPPRTRQGSSSPLAVQAAVRLYKLSAAFDPALVSYARHLDQEIAETEDGAEGPRAFKEKRKPVWKMR